jgi:hypothetical protein
MTFFRLHDLRWRAGQRVPSLDALQEFVMTATSPDGAQPAFPSPEALAATLWTFVQLKAHRFTSSDALDVVHALGDLTQLEPKTLARRLQEALGQRRVSVKYVNALQVASRMLGHSSFHAPEVTRTSQAPLQLIAAAKWLNRPARDWKEGIQYFCDYAEGDREAGSLHNVYQMGFTSTSVTMDTPRTRSHDEHGRRVPALQLQWQPEAGSQLAAAIAGVETFRRRYEETGRAIVDGLAAAYFCLHGPHADGHRDDPANSELVVIDATPGPSFGDEVARGDEVRCWDELEKVHPKDRSPTYSLDGATWAVEESRYEWRLSTIRMAGSLPSVVTRLLSIPESAKLFRRHRTAVNNRRSFVREDRIKSMPSVTAAGDLVELDEDQFRKYTSDEMARVMTVQRRVTVDTLIRVAKVLQVPDPSVLVRKPKRSELTLLQDDELLRSFISRVHDVVYEVPRRLSDEVVAEVAKAVDQMLVALKMDVVTADGNVHDAFPRLDPYMVYANQGKETLARLKRLGLVVYAGVFTNVRPFQPRSTRESSILGDSSLKVERVLFLDVDVAA